MSTWPLVASSDLGSSGARYGDRGKRRIGLANWRQIPLPAAAMDRRRGNSKAKRGRHRAADEVRLGLRWLAHQPRDARTLYKMPKPAGGLTSGEQLGPTREKLESQAWTPAGPANVVRFGLRSAVLLAIWLWLAVARALLAVALACQDGFDSLLLTWFQIESVPLNFLNDFLLQNLALEPP